ncbi:heparin lyase I family protein [Streptomyces yaizuensis]|uniref:Heparin lyase I family protein n=1 Tax=Streptomyces yaizuensis TaxID=2989713 RepID=A0ABQ5NRJ9_9ACTN|nr:heparin lyase I family protein [Streptomyces sp. YSPA8]GLF92998.1 heparin lyase I family protein [Streptomyces sp. YSPA8]
MTVQRNVRRNVTTGAAGALAATAAVMTLLAGQAHAAPVLPAGGWNGDPDTGLAATAAFGHIGSNCAPDKGSITAPSSGTRGKIWRYHKPVGSDRCESKGIKVTDDVTGAPVMHDFTPRAGEANKYYLGWESRLSSTVDNHAIFQWKSYPEGLQNWPVVLKVVNNKLTLIHRTTATPVPVTLWQKDILPNDWNHIVLGLKLSGDAAVGTIELWINGTKQTLSNGAKEYPARTWDTGNQPKWGLYGAALDEVNHDIDKVRVSTDYNDVKQP